MRIIVDADACPVKDIIVFEAKKREIEVIMIMDFSHAHSDDYSTVITVDQGQDSADFKIANISVKGDLLVTQDIGLCSMVVSKGVFCIHSNGFFINEENIDMLMFDRHIGKESRKIGKKSSHFKKRTHEDDETFRKALIGFLDKK